MLLPDWTEIAGPARSRLCRSVATMALAASCPAFADVVLEHEAHGGSVSFEVDDCLATERRRYADVDGAGESSYISGHTIDLREVSVWIRRPAGSTTSSFKITKQCESWRVAEQCIGLEVALAIEVGQEIRLGCDEMYVSCIRANHAQDRFTLHDGLDVLWWKEELGSDNVRLQRRVLTTLDEHIESCKAKSNVREAANRSDAEGAQLRARDRIREELQDLDAAFRNVVVKGPMFAPAVCGEVKSGMDGTYTRFIVFGPIGTKLDTDRNDGTFDSRYWSELCD